MLVIESHPLERKKYYNFCFFFFNIRITLILDKIFKNYYESKRQKLNYFNTMKKKSKIKLTYYPI